ncbi:MAG: hypothetical protein ACE5OT_02335 [Candidatus Hadarchaeaceae archaeon]
MPKGRKRQKASRRFEDVKKQLRKTEFELRRMEDSRWSYTKNMLRFGFATWIFGLSVFFLSIVVFGTELVAGAPPIGTYSSLGAPLLVGAPAAPVTVTAVFARRFDKKIKRLRLARSRLMARYQKAVLRYVEQMATSKG